MSKPEEKMPTEVRREFLQHLRNMAKYWAEVKGITTKERIEGGIFSVLTLLDGSTHLPAFQVIPMPCEGDKEYHIENGEDYYPFVEESPNDIAGTLHEGFYEK